MYKRQVPRKPKIQEPLAKSSGPSAGNVAKKVFDKGMVATAVSIQQLRSQSVKGEPGSLSSISLPGGGCVSTNLTSPLLSTISDRDRSVDTIETQSDKKVRRVFRGTKIGPRESHCARFFYRNSCENEWACYWEEEPCDGWVCVCLPYPAPDPPIPPEGRLGSKSFR